LALLKQSEFSQGLLAGVPPGIAVAHKFGERGYTNASKKELHDCGIVYCPQRPYVLCIMTKGTDMKEQAKAISGISKAVYDEMKDVPLQR
jgi:beta-lactamase class A